MTFDRNENEREQRKKIAVQQFYSNNLLSNIID